MSKHRKRPHVPKPESRGGDSSASPAGATAARPKRRTVTSRIEARGLDLELVATSVQDEPERDALAAAMIDVNALSQSRIDAAEEKRLQSEALREELARIAVDLDLPSRRRARPQMLTDVVALRKPRDLKHLTQMIAPVIVVIGFMTAAATLHTPPPPELPSALLGGWVTNNQDYEGRELGFVDSELVIRLEPDGPLARYPITALKSRSSGDTTALALTYTTDGGSVELHAKLLDGPNPTLVFDRPQGLVWERRMN